MVGLPLCAALGKRDANGRQKNGALKSIAEQLIVNAFSRVATRGRLWKSPEVARDVSCYRRFGDGSSDKSRTTGQSSSVARPRASSH